MGNDKKVCKVCGLYYPVFYPWGESGDIPSHDICDCCGIEFGYEDNNVESAKKAGAGKIIFLVNNDNQETAQKLKVYKVIRSLHEIKLEDF